MAADFPFLVLATGPDVARHALQAGALVLAVSREEIERGTVGDAVDRLMQLSDDPDVARHAQGRLALWVSGYDHDARELGQIPEVCAFFREIDAHWGHWLHFLDETSGQLPLLLTLLVPMFPLPSDGPQVSFVPQDPAALTACVTRLAHAYTIQAASLRLSPSAVAKRLSLLQAAADATRDPP